jgi:hypothetical protein
VRGKDFKVGKGMLVTGKVSPAVQDVSIDIKVGE